MCVMCMWKNEGEERRKVLGEDGEQEDDDDEESVLQDLGELPSWVVKVAVWEPEKLIDLSC